jgi:hypothetical protein
MSDGIIGKYPNDFIIFVDVDEVVEARDEYEALEQLAGDGSELYLCRDLVIQAVESAPAALPVPMLGAAVLPAQRRHDVVRAEA